MDLEYVLTLRYEDKKYQITAGSFDSLQEQLHKLENSKFYCPYHDKPECKFCDGSGQVDLKTLENIQSIFNRYELFMQRWKDRPVDFDENGRPYVDSHYTDFDKDDIETDRIYLDEQDGWEEEFISIMERYV